MKSRQMMLRFALAALVLSGAFLLTPSLVPEAKAGGKPCSAKCLGDGTTCYAEPDAGETCTCTCGLWARDATCSCSILAPHTPG